ncbi:MAG: hypothetical protein K6U09_00280 [Acidobacteriia bacterium]|jgi:hypothetical protein|nr:hypothetical protein [Terriglobia bacterium]
MESPLQRRQLIPPVTARTADGRLVRAWDFKQKKSLAILFLRNDEVAPGGAAAATTRLPAELAARADELRRLEAVALVILPAPAPASLTLGSPEEVVIAADITGRSQRAFLGEDAFGTAGLARVGAFVADRYGELAAHWVARDASALPEADVLFEWLSQLQLACEECGAPHWPAE